MSCKPHVPCKKNLLKATTAPKKSIKPVAVAKQFASSMKAWAKSGFKVAAKPKHAARYAICCTCQFMVGHFCPKCDCLAFAKTKLETEKCPIGKW